MEDMMKEQNAAVNEAAEYLDQIPKFSKEKHTVETVREMLKILGISQEDMKIVHIAGTMEKALSVHFCHPFSGSPDIALLYLHPPTCFRSGKGLLLTDVMWRMNYFCLHSGRFVTRSKHSEK